MRKFATIFLCFVSLYGYTQNYVFYVMANKGSNEFKTSTTNTWKLIRKGVSFQTGDRIKIVDNAYLGLVHNTGKTTALIDPGVFDIEEIESNIGLRKKGLASKYTEFVFNNIEEEKDLFADSEEQVVTRGGEDKIILQLPSSIEVLGNTITLPWKPFKSGGPYQVNVKGIFDDILFQDVTGQTQYTLDLSREELAGENTFVINISLRDNPKVNSSEHVIGLVAGDEAVIIENELAELAGELNEQSSLDQIILAGFFEEKKFLGNATNSYLQAIALSPGVEDFNDLYRDFLLRHNLNK